MSGSPPTLFQRLSWQLERRSLALERRRREAARRRLGLSAPCAPPPIAEVASLRPAAAVSCWSPPDSGIVAVAISTASHLPQLTVMAESFGRYHPDVPLFVLLLGDVKGASHLPFQVVTPAEIGFPRSPYLYLKFDITELCCAAKPPLVRWALERLRAERVLYLDADMCFYSRATALLDESVPGDVIVTPHLLTPFPFPERRWEAPTLGDIAAAGILNAGLFSVRRSAPAMRFLRIWDELCAGFGAFDTERGLQHEQNSFNWVLSFCESVRILRDPAYNVAYWNLHERSLGLGEGGFTADGRPLVAFHWSGFDLQDPSRLSRYDRRHSLFLHDVLVDLVADYVGRLDSWTGRARGVEGGGFDRFPSGIGIDARMRRIFKRWELELATAVEPFSPAGEAHYGRALMAPVAGSGTLCPILLASIISERRDLQTLFPDHALRPDAVLRWFSEFGAAEYGYSELFDRHRATVFRADRLAEIEAALPRAVRGRSREPLRSDRRALIETLTRCGGSLAEFGRHLERLGEELYAGTRIGLLRRLVTARQDIRAHYPRLLFEDAAAFRSWVQGYGEIVEGLPRGTADVFARVAGGRALARVFTWVQRTDHLARAWPLAFVGIGWEELNLALLECLASTPEYDLEDLEMAAWVVEEEPWRGLPLVLELRPSACGALDPPAKLAEEGLLAPVLGRDARFHAALTAYRRDRPWRYRRPAHGSRRRSGLELPMGPVRGLARRGAHIFGYAGSEIGLGTMSRGLAAALRDRGFELCENVLGNVSMRADLGIEDVLLKHEPAFPVNLWVSYPHRTERLFDLVPSYLAEGRRNVVYLAWEQPTMPRHWTAAFEDFDDVWALSEFAAESLRRGLGRPVTVVPCVLETDGWPSRPPRQRTLLPRDRFVFTFVFDANSSIERKNPEAVVDALGRAFRRSDPVTLWLRVAHAHREENRGRLRRLIDRANEAGLDIRLDTGSRSRLDILRLLAESDAYVSLHRAEGFGYTCAEAMALGVPTIASGYSGNLQFMTHENSFLVDTVETEVEIGDGPFVRGTRWGAPDTSHAAELMRTVFEDPERARKVAERGREEVRRLLSPRTVGLRCERLLGAPDLGPESGEAHAGDSPPSRIEERPAASWGEAVADSARCECP